MQKLLNLQDLAKLTGLAPQTIYNRRCHGGSLPRAISIGRHIKFRPEDVENWLNGLQLTEPEPEVIAPKPTRVGRPTKEKQVSRRKTLH